MDIIGFTELFHYIFESVSLVSEYKNPLAVAGFSESRSESFSRRARGRLMASYHWSASLLLSRKSLWLITHFNYSSTQSLTYALKLQILDILHRVFLCLVVISGDLTQFIISLRLKARELEISWREPLFSIRERPWSALRKHSDEPCQPESLTF